MHEREEEIGAFVPSLDLIDSSGERGGSGWEVHHALHLMLWWGAFSEGKGGERQQAGAHTM